MEGKNTEGVGARAGDESAAPEAAPGEALPCCVLREVVRDGRVVNVCAATCCRETQAA